MSTKEILTLQFGHYPNFVGTHWWNSQESSFEYSENAAPSEINHDVLYREGLTYKGEVTFTPRLLLVDLKGSLKTLLQEGELYGEACEPNLETIPWNQSAVEVKYEEKPQKNVLQQELSQVKPELSKINNLDSEVEVWSDFLYTRFHPKSVNIINEYKHNNEDNAFDVFNLGVDLWKTNQFEDDFSDKIRSYIEECDNSQGFQMLVDTSSAFAGLATGCLEHLRDDYNKKSILSFQIIPSYYSDYNVTSAEDRTKSTLKDTVRLINLLLSMDAFSENSCLTIPLCTGTKGWRQPGMKRNFKNLNYDNDKYYHSSAIIASYLDTITLPYRLKTSCFTLNDFCADLNKNNRKIAAASLNLPFGLNSNQYLIDYLDTFEGALYQSITPNYKLETDKTLQHVVLRGVQQTQMKKMGLSAGKQREMQAYACENVKEMMEYYLRCSCFFTTSHVTAATSGVSTKVPFPDIFSEFVDARGNISNNPRAKNQRVQSVPVIAGCHSSANIGDMLESLHRESSRIKIGKMHQFRTSGLEDDEYNECLHRIQNLKECYEEDYDI